MAADAIVMPLSFSCGRKSITVSPRSTLPTESILPVTYRICSVVVVLPASIWATIPTLRILEAKAISAGVMLWDKLLLPALLSQRGFSPLCRAENSLEKIMTDLLSMLMDKL